VAVILLRAIPLVLVGTAFVVWLRIVRNGEAKPAALALCASLAFLTVAMLVQLLFDPLKSVVPLPGFQHFLMHTCGMVAAFFLTVFCLHIGQPSERINKSIALRRWVLMAALVLLSVLYVLGPVRGELTRITSESGQTEQVVEYLAVFAGYMGFTMIDVVWISRNAPQIANVWIRRGLITLGVGAATGLVYAALRVSSAVATAIGSPLPWPNAGPGGIGTYFMLASVILLMVGIMLPPLGQRRDDNAAAQSAQSQPEAS
jgi:hypothetical protein